MEISPNITNTGTVNNSGITPDNSAGAFLGDKEAEKRQRHEIYKNFGDNPHTGIRLHDHGASNIASLRVFPDNRNLYEILLNKEAKHKKKKTNWYAATGSAIGTLVPALIFYSMKMKRGQQVKLNVLEGITNLGSKEFNYANIRNSIKNVTKEASPELDKVLSKLDELNKTKPDEALKKLLAEAGYSHKVEDLFKKEVYYENGEKLYRDKFYYGKGKEAYFESLLDEAHDLYKTGTNFEKNRSFLSYIPKTDEFSLKEVLLIGLGSITGGYIGGVAGDKGEVNKKKTKEATYQLINNIICPTILTEQFVHHLNLDIKPPEGALKGLEKVKHAGVALGAIVAGVGIGINVGTRIANFVNKQYFKDEKYQRKIGLFDVFIHVDDVPLALNFMHIKLMDKLLIFCSGLCGYEAGKKE